MLFNHHKSTLFFSLFTSIILFNGCSSHETFTSDTHLYNNQYGLVPDPTTDAIIAKEIQSEYQDVEIIYQEINPAYTTKLQHDPDAFLAEEWVKPEPVISYKYSDDPRFYSEEELPDNKLKLGNVIVKIPEGADRSMLLR